MVYFTCDQCGRKYIYHTAHPVFSCDQCDRSFARSNNLEKHKCTCTGARGAVPVAAPAAKKRCTGHGVAPEYKLQKTRKSLGGAVEQFTMNMKEVKYLSTLKKTIAVVAPVMTRFHQEQRAYKFQIAVSVVFHKAVDPAVITQPPLDDVNRQLLNFIEVYEHNGQVGYSRSLLLSS